MKNNYEKLLGQNTPVFRGDPDKGPAESGVIPDWTVIRVRTTSGWPRGKEGYVPVVVEQVKMLATPENQIVGPNEISAGGFTLSTGQEVYIPSSFFQRK